MVAQLRLIASSINIQNQKRRACVVTMARRDCNPSLHHSHSSLPACRYAATHCPYRKTSSATHSRVCGWSECVCGLRGWSERVRVCVLMGCWSVCCVVIVVVGWWQTSVVIGRWSCRYAATHYSTSRTDHSLAATRPPTTWAGPGK